MTCGKNHDNASKQMTGATGVPTGAGAMGEQPRCPRCGEFIALTGGHSCDAPVVQASLFFREGSSDKVYQAKIEIAGDKYVVNFAYGRRGATLQTGTKTSSPVDLGAAQKIYDKVLAEKKAKGYQEGQSGEGTYTTANANDTGVRCQLLNPIDEAEAKQLIQSPEWWAQEKRDGRRLLVKKDAGSITAINRRGLSAGAPDVILAGVNGVAGDCLVDGEAVGEKLFAFDLIAPELPYNERLSRLEALGLSGAVVVVETARTTAEKQQLYDRLSAAGAEGIVFKKHAAPYTAGRPNSGGTQVKYKFYNTASVIVTGNNDKRSVGLAILNGDSQLPVGNVTIPPNQKIPPVGAVVEVRYLYAYKGGSLFQPIFLGERTDVEADSIDDLKFKPENG